MKPEAQRIAIAEACGWNHEYYPGGVPWGSRPNNPKTWWFTYQLPDYLNDLNAMHEVEARMKPEQRWDYCNELNEITGAFKQDPEFWATEWPSVNATAAERAKAFLKTIRKWIDE